MNQVSTPMLIMRRLADNWKLLVSVFIGILLATTLSSGAPLYLDTLEQLDFNAALDRIPSPVVQITIFGTEVPISEKPLQEVEQSVVKAIERHLSEVYLAHETAVEGATSIIGVPTRPLPQGGGRGVLLSRGFLQALSNLDSHSRIVQGRMPAETVGFGTRGPLVEAVLDSGTAERFQLSVGVLLAFSPTLESTTVIEAEIVGIFEPDDLDSGYWIRASVLLDPPPLPPDAPSLVQIDIDEPPVTPFVNEDALLDAIGEPGFSFLLGPETYQSSGNYLVGVPQRPLPEAGGIGVLIPLGNLQSISNFSHHVRFIDGGPPSSKVAFGPRGPEVEALISPTVSSKFLLEVGDTVTVAPGLGDELVITATVVGIVEPLDPTGDYWANVGVLLDPTPLVETRPEPDLSGESEAEEITRLTTFNTRLPQGVQALPDAPTVPLILDRDAMVGAVLAAFPGALARQTWFIQIDKEKIKQLSVAQARERFQAFEKEVLKTLPGATASTGVVKSLTGEGRRANFLSKVPLLLMVTVMVVTVLLFLSMMVSYLVESRESDAALLGTRGASTMQLLRIYTLEGLMMTAVAVVTAPFLAAAAVTLAGKLPPFTPFGDGALLPVDIWPTPYLAAIAVGILCLAIFVVPGVLGARGGLLVHRLRSARPPTLPLFHRYYIDVALLALGGLIFWELHSRGQFVSGGLFKEAEVDETLLLAPILFLIVVALVFMRLFPMVVRFISGESPSAVHLYSAAAVGAMAVALGVSAARENDVVPWLASAAVVAALAALYWATNFAPYAPHRLAGILLQAVLAAGLLIVEPLERGSILFAPTIAILAIVPVQLAYHLFKQYVRLAPAWLILGLWHMSRSPMRYSWLILLLVLVTGVGILATTLGGTLERSQKDQIQYDVASDFRVSRADIVSGGIGGFERTLASIPGTTPSMALRTTASIDTGRVKLLAVETGEFESISWYRDDFSSVPFDKVIERIRPKVSLMRLALPPGANSIAVRVKPLAVSPFASLGVILEDDVGAVTFVTLQNLIAGEWNLLGQQIPSGLQPPIYLMSLLIAEPPDLILQAVGSILIDDIQVTVGPNDEVQVLDDFEGELRWVPLAFSSLQSDHSLSVVADAFRGEAAVAFSYGGKTLRGFRGFFYSPTEGYLPGIASPTLLDKSGSKVGEVLSLQVAGRFVPVEIVDTVDYFPTMDPDESFLLTDLRALLGHVNVLPSSMNLPPNELFIRSTDEALASVRAALAATLPDPEQARDGAALLESLSLNPFTSAGWKPMVYLAPAVGILAAAVGYVTYLLLFTKRSGSEMGSLETMGLSRLQAMALLGFEHLTVAAIGLALGTWAGFQMSSLIVSPLATTETGDPVVPPFILTTDWDLLLAAFAALVAILVVALLVLSSGIRRVNLHSLSRLGGL